MSRQPSLKPGHNSIPQDQGWAWMVLLGSLLNQTVILTFVRAMSILMLRFLEEFQTSAMNTTLSSGLSALTGAVTSIVIGTYFIPRYPARHLLLLASTLCVLSLSVLTFAPNIVVLNVVFALIGISNFTLNITHMTLVGHYFKKYLTLAMAVWNLGISFSTISSAPFAQFLLEKYGLQGTLLIFTGFECHLFVGSALSRSVSRCRTQTARDEKRETLLGNVDPEPLPPNDCGHTTNILGERVLCDEGLFGSTKTVKDGSIDVVLKETTLRTCSETENKSRFIDMTVGLKSHSSLTFSGDLSSPPSEQYKSQPQLSAETTNHSGRFASVLSKSMESLSERRSLRYLSQPEVSPSTVFLSSLPMSSSRQHECKGVCKEPWSECIDSHGVTKQVESNRCALARMKHVVSQSVLFKPLPLLLISAGGIGQQFLPCILYTAAIGKENGLSDGEVPYLVTVVGISDIFCRLWVGWLADRAPVRLSILLCITQITTGIILCLLTLCRSFTVMLAVEFGLGLTMGAVQILISVMFARLVGVEFISKCASICYMITGCSQFLVHLSFGAIKDSTGSFHGGSYVLAGTLIISGLLISLECCLTRSAKQSSHNGICLSCVPTPRR